MSQTMKIQEKWQEVTTYGCFCGRGWINIKIRHCKQYFRTLKTWFFFSTYDTKAYDELEHVQRTWLPIKNTVKSHLALFTYKTFTDSLERFRAPTYASFSCTFTKSNLKWPFPPWEGIICGTAIFQITGRINIVNLPNYYFTAPRLISNWKDNG